MPTDAIEVVVLIVCYNGRDYLEECLTSVDASDDGSPNGDPNADPNAAPIRKHVLLIDNASTDGSVEFVAERFPHVECIAAGSNLGFAGGNQLGWEHIAEHHPAAKYVCLLNQDTIVESDWLRPLVNALEADPNVACVQAKVLLHPRTDVINTVGNQCHFLGFGFTTGYGETDHGQYDRRTSIDFASGAAMLLRADVLREVGLFDPILFLYMEDVDLAWKIRQLGHDIVYVPESRVYHKYAFGQVYDHYFYMERNRWWILLTYYKWPTLVLLAPALAIMEFGQLWFSWRRGRLREKWRSYQFFFQRANREKLAARRCAAQRRRTVGDRAFMRCFKGLIRTPELDGWLIRWVANPIFGLYWQVARRLIFW